MKSVQDTRTLTFDPQEVQDVAEIHHVHNSHDDDAGQGCLRDVEEEWSQDCQC